MHKSERNGFSIQENDEYKGFPFVVSLNKQFIDAYKTLEDAEGFCDDNSAELWKITCININ
ncbi:hypothetical protein ACFC0X_24925 [Paenibacillus chitinolyticus]|uniref:hypothetical protein n=1 Tax=Paenibacillus chitinolyticus TaxID=79263 RepID=UPI0035E2FCE5